MDTWRVIWDSVLTIGASRFPFRTVRTFHSKEEVEKHIAEESAEHKAVGRSIAKWLGKELDYDLNIDWCC